MFPGRYEIRIEAGNGYPNYSGEYYPDPPKRPRSRGWAGFLIKSLFLAIFFVIVTAAIFAAVYYKDLKGAYDQAVAGRDKLELGIAHFKEKKFEQALAESIQARDDIEAAKETIEAISSSFLASSIPLARSQLSAVSVLLEGASTVASVLADAVDYTAEMDKLFIQGKPFSALPKEEKMKILGFLYESDARFSAWQSQIGEARRSIDNIRFWGVLEPYKPKIEQFNVNLALAESALKQAVPASRLIPELAGYSGRKHFLFLLQNPDELRSTGGFIGTYGLVAAEAGDLLVFETHDIYHIDMPVQDKISVPPPPPIAAYLNKKWYLRDSNWAPDFPTAARKALEFYSLEEKVHPKPGKIQDFDGVIAITPDLIISMLAIIGPITIENVKYDKDNFTKLLEYRVEKGYVQMGIPSWERKEVIGEIASELKRRLFDLPLTRWPEVFSVLSRGMEKKNMLVFFEDNGLEELAREQGIDGAVKTTGGDYAMAVDFNMAALKTDAVVEKSIYYKVEQEDDGIYATLRIGYEHKGSFDWRTTRYQTYTRLYAPLGSLLQETKGISKGEAYTGEEFGKTFFGAYTVIEPGKVGSLSYRYKLPASIAEQVKQKEYTLLFQKQPGSRIKKLTVDISLGKPIKSRQLPAGEVQDQGGGRLVWMGEFETDQEFSLGF